MASDGVTAQWFFGNPHILEDGGQLARRAGLEVQEVGQVGGARPAGGGGRAQRLEHHAQLLDVALPRPPRPPQQQLCTQRDSRLHMFFACCCTSDEGGELHVRPAPPGIHASSVRQPSSPIVPGHLQTRSRRPTCRLPTCTVCCRTAVLVPGTTVQIPALAHDGETVQRPAKEPVPCFVSRGLCKGMPGYTASCSKSMSKLISCQAGGST